MGVFGEPEVAFLCLAGVDVALTERTDATLPEWVSVDGRIRAVWPLGQRKVNNPGSDRPNLLSSTSRQVRAEVTVYRKLQDHFSTERLCDIIVSKKTILG